MASPTTPTHGKYGAIYRLRPNGFKGNGLNDLTFGTGFSGASSAYYEVVIDGVGTGGGGADTFKWRKNGGAWTETVDVTGAAQALDDGQTVTFGATTGHTANDQWVIGNLKDEACDESGTEGQITDSGKRLLNANAEPTFSDSGGETVLTLDCVRGKAVFTGNVTTVTVSGNNGYIPAAALEKVGYLIDWNFAAQVDMADITVMQDKWKTALPGLAGASGGANAYFIGVDSFWDSFEDTADGTQDYFLLQLYNYDPDDDQTGDHFTGWAILTGFDAAGQIGEIVKESVKFQIHGYPAFTSNV